MLLILFSFADLSYAQQSPQALFDQANKGLESGDYQQAISQYKQLEQQNTVSGALYLNLGISYQHVDSLGEAKFYFLKASQFEETEPKAQKALNYVESQFSHQSAVLPKLPWDIATRWLQDHVGSSLLLAISIILLNLGVLIFISQWFVRRFHYPIRMSGIVIISLALLIMIASFYTDYVSERYSTAVMVSAQSPVTEKADPESSLISQTFEGYTFTVDQYHSKDHPGWKYIRMSNGLYGWIPSKKIMIL